MRILMLLLLLLVFTFPSESFASRSGEVENLRERAEAYWRARVSSSANLERFYPPQDVDKPSRMLHGSALRLQSATVMDLEITDDTAVVATLLRVDGFSFPANPLVARHLAASALLRAKEIRHAWIRLDGVWYRESTPPFGGLFHRTHTGSVK